MGFGDEPFGEFPFGMDSLGALPPAPVNRIPDAVRLDFETRRHLIDNDGNFVSQHPVDHEMQMAMAIVSGDLRSTNTTGNTIDRVKFIGPQHDAEVKNRIQLAARALTDRKAARIDKISVNVPFENRTRTVVEYTNLLTDKPEKAFVE